MLTARRLLVPASPGFCTALALAYALDLAERLGSEVHLVRAEVPVDTLEDDLEIALPPVPEGIRFIEATATGDNVVKALLDYTDQHEIDLIVMGTHGRHGLAHVILGSIAEAIVREAGCPVLTVGVQEADRSERAALAPRAIRRILAPIDFSERAEAGLKHAIALAELYGATVDVLHAVDVPALPEVYELGLILVTPDLVERSRESLADIVARLIPAEQRGKVFVEVNAPAAAILDLIRDREIDLVVMATHGLTGLKRFALGSVTERVIRRAACPIFTVKSFEKSLLPAASEEATTTVISGDKEGDSAIVQPNAFL
jgi:nucleotide-binding universal stress UspA family protein